jgi:hypothetical protein
LARTACALERYRLVHGTYPAGLDSLVPQFLESVPHDVIDGAPLRFECADGSQFRLYSVALSGIDEHSWPRKPAVKGWETKEGYWAWVQPPRS